MWLTSGLFIYVHTHVPAFTVYTKGNTERSGEEGVGERAQRRERQPANPCGVPGDITSSIITLQRYGK